MSPTRREALAQLSALLAVPMIRWPERAADPLSGTIAAFQAGRLRIEYIADGMPAGNLSFVGLPGDDRCVLALAHAYEQQSRRFVAPLQSPR